MNKIEKLLNELCPDGVEFKELGDVANFRRGSFPQPYWESKWYDWDWAMPFVQVVDVDFNNKLVKDTKKKISKLAQPKSIFVPSWTVIVTLQGSIWRVAITQYDCYVDRTLAIFESFKEEIDKKYFLYQLEAKFNIEKESARGSTIKTITKEEFTKFQIPIPPIEIQKEIVKILDTFTLLEAELEAELEARKKQYEYYRDWIFIINSEIKETNLDDLIISLKTWLNPRKNFVLNTVDAENYYVTVRELWGIDINFYDKTDRVNNEALRLINNRSNLEVWDVLFSWTWTIWRTALVKEKPKNWNIKEGVYVIKPNKIKIDSKFLLFYLNSNQAKKQIDNKIVGSPVSSIPMSELKKIKIPVPFKDWEPDLEKQKEIVETLDKFDALVNDISVWLPAELKARRQQYEYYRNKLLDFKVLEK